MKWYEFLNFCIITSTLVGSLYLFFKFIYLPKERKTLMTTRTVYIVLNGLVLVQIYDMLTAISWARNNICGIVLGVPHHLYVVAAITKNVYFLIMVIGVIVWVNRKD